MGLDITGLGSVFDFANGVINRLFPDPDKRQAAILELQKMEQDGALQALASEVGLAQAQIAVNQEEAKSERLFVSGWRPACGWLCVGALAYHSIIQPFIVFVLTECGHEVVLPEFDISTLNVILQGMLGLVASRSFEKFKGIASK